MTHADNPPLWWKHSDPKYWRAHAEDARARAKQMKNRKAQRTTLEIAEISEELARMADALADGTTMQNPA